MVISKRGNHKTSSQRNPLNSDHGQYALESRRIRVSRRKSERSTSNESASPNSRVMSVPIRFIHHLLGVRNATAKESPPSLFGGLTKHQSPYCRNLHHPDAVPTAWRRGWLTASSLLICARQLE